MPFRRASDRIDDLFYLQQNVSTYISAYIRIALRKLILYRVNKTLYSNQRYIQSAKLSLLSPIQSPRKHLISLDIHADPQEYIPTQTNISLESGIRKTQRELLSPLFNLP